MAAAGEVRDVCFESPERRSGLSRAGVVENVKAAAPRLAVSHLSRRLDLARVGGSVKL